jgi:hypothetical protein
VKKEDPTGPWHSPTSGAAKCRATRVRSTAPSQHMLAQHVGDLSCPHNCTGLLGRLWPRQPGCGRELPLSDHYPTTYGGTISSARGAAGAQRRSEAPTSLEQVSEYGTPVKARPWCVRQNGRSQRVHLARAITPHDPTRQPTGPGPLGCTNLKTASQ